MFLDENPEEINSGEEFQLHISPEYSQETTKDKSIALIFSSANEKEYPCDELKIPIIIPSSLSSPAAQNDKICRCYVAEQFATGYPLNLTIKKDGKVRLKVERENKQENVWKKEFTTPEVALALSSQDDVFIECENIGDSIGPFIEPYHVCSKL